MIVDHYPLSPVQQGMLFHQVSGDQPGVDVEQIIIQYAEPPKLECLEKAWQAEFLRHPAMRTSFEWRDGSAPYQQVHNTANITIDIRDVAEARLVLPEFLRTDRLRGFDLTSPPLMRLTFFRESHGAGVLVWTLHHIVMDGRGFVIVLSEVEDAYRKLVSGQEVPASSGPAYRPYIDWMQTLDTSAGQSFWSEYLSGFTAPTPMPQDRPAGGHEGSRHGEHERRLSFEVTSNLRKIAVDEDVTLNTIVMAAWGMLLGRYSGEHDVLFGATKTTRRGSIPGAESIVGLFLNTVPVKLSLPPNEPVSDVLRRLRAEWLQIRAHEHTPLTTIRSATTIPSSANLFDSLVVFESEAFEKTLAKIQPQWLDRKWRLLEQTNFALTLAVYGDPEMLLKLEYDATRFSEEKVTRMSDHLQQILESIAADPTVKLADLQYLPQSESRRILTDFNPRPTDYRAAAPLHELLEAQVAQSPGAVAVTFGEESLTYAELNASANQLARELRRHGAGPNQLVGLCLERSLDMMVALLAICKSGAAYVPIDPYLPAERMGYMIADSGLRLLISDRETRASLPDFHGTLLEVEEGSWRNNDSANLAVSVGPEDLAYVIYTSGSTGKPKGVEVPRRALTNLLGSVRDWFEFTERDCLLAVTTISFDIAGADIWLPWLVGAHTVLASREAAADGQQLRSLMQRYGVTFLQATPVTWRLLLDAGWPGGDVQIVCTGEAMPQDLATSLAPIVPRLWNMYGPTETTIWSTGYRVQAPTAPVLIGRPVANTRCYILDELRRLVPIGALGELYIAGDGLARGYRNRPELTAEKFVDDPFHSGERMYRTGDLARHGSDGNIECLGRTDHQVKIRGFRIELGEIEAALRDQAGVDQTVVIVREDAPGDKRLVAYVVCGSTAPSTADLRKALKQRLPDYMIPAAFVNLDRLPVTPNAKIDRKALPAPEAGESEVYQPAKFQSPRTSTEIRIAGIFAAVLSTRAVGLDDDFFELGGHSLSAARVIAQINAAFGTNLPIRVLFQAKTVEQVASLVEANQSGVGGRATEWPVLIPIQTSGSRPPLFCVARPNINALGFVFLSHDLGQDQPCYGLQMQLEEVPKLDFTEEQYRTTASTYVQAMQSVQARGPYYLVGQCQGAFIAFEMARQLEAAGERVALLGILDTWVVENTLRKWLFYAEAVRIRFRLVREIGLRPALRRLLAVRSKPASPATGSGADAPAVAAPVNFTYAMKFFPGKDFKFTTYSGVVTVFKVSKQLRRYKPDDKLGWAQRALGGVEVELIPGEHTTYLRPPHVKVLADKIHRRIPQVFENSLSTSISAREQDPAYTDSHERAHS